MSSLYNRTEREATSGEERGEALAQLVAQGTHLPDRALTEEYVLRYLQQILLAIGGRQFKVKIAEPYPET